MKPLSYRSELKAWPALQVPSWSTASRRGRPNVGAGGHQVSVVGEVVYRKRHGACWTARELTCLSPGVAWCIKNNEYYTYTVVLILPHRQKSEKG